MDSEEEFYSASSGDEEPNADTKYTAKTKSSETSLEAKFTISEIKGETDVVLLDKEDIFTEKMQLSVEVPNTKKVSEYIDAQLEKKDAIEHVEYSPKVLDSSESSKLSDREIDAGWEWGQDEWDSGFDNAVTQSKPNPKKLSFKQGSHSSTKSKCVTNIDLTLDVPSVEPPVNKLSIHKSVELDRKSEEISFRPPTFESLAGESAPKFGTFGLFSGLMNGGLDALEALGRKTFENLTVKDKKGKSRLFFNQSSDEPLSDLLKRLKHAEAEENLMKRTPARVSFLSLLAVTTTMQHVEALELLSTTLTSTQLKQSKATINSTPSMSATTPYFRKQITSFSNNKFFASIDLFPAATAFEHLEIVIEKSTNATPEEAYPKILEALVDMTQKFVQMVSKLTQLHSSLDSSVGKEYADFLCLLRSALLGCEQFVELLPKGEFQGEDLAMTYLIDCDSAHQLLERIFKLSTAILDL